MGDLSGYKVTLEAMRQRAVDVPGVVDDIRECLRRGIDVPPGQTLAVIDFLIEVNEGLRDTQYGLMSALEKHVPEYDSDEDIADEIECTRCYSSGIVPTEGHESVTGNQNKTCPQCRGAGESGGTC